MKLLIIGKVPPIEGGVSGQTFWLANALARLGHDVDIVTNALEVEPCLRQHIEPDATEQGPNGAGLPRIHYTTPVPRDSYIPFARPYLTQLVGLSMRVIREHGCDAILSWYFEPYAMAAATVAAATGVPFFVRHAGSDLGRLSHHQDLQPAYDWMLRSASGLLVTNAPELDKLYCQLDVPQLAMKRPGLPSVFDARHEPLDVDRVAASADCWFQRSGVNDATLERVLEGNRRAFVPRGCVIGVYGKVGPTKGSFDLLTALGRLARRGLDFSLLTMSCGRAEALQHYYDSIVEDEVLHARTWVLPPLPPWRVPAFLARCDAIAFLERGFSIPFHGPMVPMEALSMGSCLVCSREVAAKRFFQGNLVHRRNAIIVEDPTNHDRLADELACVILDAATRQSIGRQGQKLYRFFAEELCTQEESAAALVRQMTLIIASRDASDRLPVQPPRLQNVSVPP